jgi:hypothetical protein
MGRNARAKQKHAKKPDKHTQKSDKCLAREGETHQEEPKLCRFCLDESKEEDQLVIPCSCKGSMAYVHQSCLSRWQYQKLDNQRMCMVCRQPWLIRAQQAQKLLPDYVKCIASAILPAALVLSLSHAAAALVPRGSRRHRVALAIVAITSPVFSWTLNIAACYAIYSMRYALEMQRFEMHQSFAEQANESVPMWWQAGSPIDWL